MQFILLINGRIAHSISKISITIDEYSTCIIKKRCGLCESLKEVDLIIFEGAQMSSKLVFKSIDRSLKNTCNLNELFGGKQIGFSGDFRQILPIIKHGGKEDIIDMTIFN